MCSRGKNLTSVSLIEQPDTLSLTHHVYFTLAPHTQLITSTINCQQNTHQQIRHSDLDPDLLLALDRLISNDLE